MYRDIFSKNDRDFQSNLVVDDFSTLLRHIIDYLPDTDEISDLRGALVSKIEELEERVAGTEAMQSMIMDHLNELNDSVHDLKFGR